MQMELDELRNKIDKIDNDILFSLSQRLALVTKIGEIKYKYGLSIYSPDREEIILSSCRKKAINLGISPDLIEDILRRIIRESYSNENIKGFKTVHPNLRSIVIIGGNGQMGQLFNKMLSLSGYEVYVLEKEDWLQAKNLISNAGMVIISVPINNTVEIIKKLPKMQKDCILTDLTSIKFAPLKTMLLMHTGPVLGLHPMFNPKICNLAKQIIIYCNGRYPESYQWFLQQIQIWGVCLYQINALKHDYNMSFIQTLRHVNTFMNGYHLFKENVHLKELFNLSSSSYRLELIIIGRLFSQNPQLCADIIMSSKNNLILVKRFNQRLKNIIKLIEKKDKKSFINIFKKVSKWFNDYTEQSLSESNILLNQVNDMRKHHI